MLELDLDRTYAFHLPRLVVFRERVDGEARSKEPREQDDACENRSHTYAGDALQRVQIRNLRQVDTLVEAVFEHLRDSDGRRRV